MDIYTAVIEELALDGEVQLTVKSPSSVRRYIREINQRLEREQVNWRCHGDPKTGTLWAKTIASKK